MSIIRILIFILHWHGYHFSDNEDGDDCNDNDKNDDDDYYDDYDDEVGVFLTIVFDSIVGVTHGQEGRAGGGALLEVT